MIAPHDDHVHPVGPEPNFNESMYFHFHDPVHQLGGFLRLANRANEGRGERTVCLYLPGGAVAFGFDRPRFADNTRFDAGGMTVEVLTPFEELAVGYDGPVNVLTDPSTMTNPKIALSTSLIVDCRASLRLHAAAPPYAETFDGTGESFAPNHYEQLMRVAGRVRVGDSAYSVDGHGLRDHSWGPRSWQAPWFYRWLHGSAHGIGFMAAYFGDADGTDRTGGFVWDGGQLQVCHDVAVSTIRDAEQHNLAVTVTLRNTRQQWVFHGEIDNSVPLRHRTPEGAAATRIVESTATWTSADGQTLHGMAEYLDQIVEGVPVGLRI